MSSIPMWAEVTGCCSTPWQCLLSQAGVSVEGGGHGGTQPHAARSQAPVRSLLVQRFEWGCAVLRVL